MKDFEMMLFNKNLHTLIELRMITMEQAIQLWFERVRG